MKRTTVITAVAAAAVMVTSGAAIAANLGILSTTSHHDLGTLSATIPTAAEANSSDSPVPLATVLTTDTDQHGDEATDDHEEHEEHEYEGYDDDD
ncbi:MAG: hypothetical protein AB7L17_19330 [Ilumatobacteraceae bacterium]